MENPARRIIRNKIQDNLHPDKVSCSKEGEWVTQFGYFYRHGRSCGKYADQIRSLFPDVQITGMVDKWHPWPKDSYFKVWFKVN